MHLAYIKCNKLPQLALFFKAATFPVLNLFPIPDILWFDPEDEGLASGANE